MRPKNMMAKRAILYSDKATDEERNAAADSFIAEERFGEALEFLELTKDASRLSSIANAAHEKGDTFLLTVVAKIGGRTVSAEEWRRIADRAASLGRYYDAYRAHGNAGDEEAAEALREKHLPEHQPFRPEGK